MKACKISIILPVYNTSEYLDECMQSLVCQSLEDIEIIAVNDGSTDNSFEILRKYQAEYPGKVYVYNTENHGVSSARNFAVQKSCGEYLWFVDSDDYIEPFSCEKLYSKAHDDDNDLLLFSRYDVDGVTGEKAANKTFHFNQNFRMSDKPYELIKLSPFPWNKLVKKELFEKTHFPQGIRFEDLPVAFILAANAKNIGVINDWFYDYRKQVGFLSRFTHSTLDIVKAVDYMKTELEKQGKFDAFKTELEYVTLRHFLYRFEHLFTIYDGESTELKKELIETLFNYLESNYPNCFENPYICYNLPGRMYRLIDFYSSKKALLEYVEACRNLNEQEQDEYTDRLKESYESTPQKERIAFGEVRKASESASREFKSHQGEMLEKNALFISHTANSVSPSMLSIMLKLSRENAITLYSPYAGKRTEKLLASYGIIATIINNKNSDYLSALATSRYVVSDCPADHFYTKAEGQIYINNFCEIPVSRLIPKDNCLNEFPLVQRSLITADCTIYTNEKSRQRFERKYKVEGLGVKSIDNYSPYCDKAVKTDVKTALSFGAQKLIAIVPQHRRSDSRQAQRFFRKFLQQLFLLDKELDDNCIAYLYTGDITFDVNTDVFNHIKELPDEYGIYDFIKASDIVITDYHPLLTVCDNSKVLRLIIEEKRYLTDKELSIGTNNFITFDNGISLANYINDYRFVTSNCATSKTDTNGLFEALYSNKLIVSNSEKPIALWYLGGNITPARIKRFKNYTKENSDMTFWIAFDEENAGAYTEEFPEFFKKRNYIPLRYDSTSSFSDKIIDAIYSKGKPPFNSSKKLAEMKNAEWKKYFGDIRFDEITLISVGRLEQNLLFIGACAQLRYSFNWFSADKYNSKGPFKSKVDYICKELAEAQARAVKIPEEMKTLKITSKLNLTDKI